MKRLRKPAALLLALVMALTLAACGGKGARQPLPWASTSVRRSCPSMSGCPWTRCMIWVTTTLS